MNSIFQPGRNCVEVAHTDRAALLIDAEAYFKAFVQAAEAAQRSIIILAWDFDSRTALDPVQTRNDTRPAVLGDFLNFLARRRRTLNIFVLDWDYPMVFGTDREFPPLLGLGWTPGPRVHFRYDNTHPVGGSHHQKIVVIDDAVGFSGGLDLTSRRWDTCEHRAADPRRNANGNAYPPFHDLMAMVDGEAARGLGRIARQRWRLATGTAIPTRKAKSDPWPADVPPDMTDVMVGISRTMPGARPHAEIREVEALYLDMIAAARRYIYIENQYFTSPKVSDALAVQLSREDGPEIVIVLRLLSHGWLEEHTMHALRTRLIKQLRDADRWNRCGIYYPHIDGLLEGTCIDVHSKALVVDDEWLRIGSSNLCNRSMGMDSECDVTFEARGEPRITSAIRGFRERLLGEHLGISAQEVQDQFERTGSLNRAIDILKQEGRTLKALEDLPQVPEVVMDLASVADPERPVSLEKLVGEFAPVMPTEKSGSLRKTVVFIGLWLAVFLALWHFTPLAEVVTAERSINLARDIGGRWWAPLIVLAAYTPACLIMFPRPLITLFSIIAFGTWLGVGYAFSGILISALVTYMAGRLMRRATVRRLAGSKLSHVSEMLRKRGLVSITALRLVPVAPFAVLGLVAGAIHIKLWHYMLGSAIGLLPGTVVTTVFGDQLETALRDPSQINYWLLVGIAACFVVAILLVRRFVFDGGFLKSSPPQAAK